MINKINILLVDDNENLLKSYSAALNTSGYNLIKADSGTTALKKAMKYEFAVILMDVNMPGMDGFETAQLLRSRKQSASTPIIFISGDNKEFKDMLKGYEIGALDYILKPVNEDLLKSKIASYVQRYCLLESERIANRKFEITMKSLNEGIIAFDESGTIFFLNNEAKKLTGFLTEEAVGQIISKILNVSLNNKKITLDMFLVHKKRYIFADNNLFSIESYSGDKTDIQISLSEIVDNKKSYGTVAVLKDMTETIKLQEATRKIENLESLADLSAGIAHNFNNLLCSVIGNIDLAKSISTNKEVLLYLNEALKSADITSQLTSELLTFSTGGLPSCKMSELKDFIVSQIEQLVSKTDHTYALHCSEETNKCLYDPKQLSLVFKNIFKNAIEDMKKNGHIDISIRSYINEKDEYPNLKKNKYIEVKIKDIGNGIEAKNLSRIFNPFFTTKYGHYGLGLPTCFSIINQHRGHIEIQSEIKKGTTVKILLPSL